MKSALGLLASATLVSAIYENHFDLTWINRAADGFSRPVVGCNGAICPDIEVDVGDTVLITVTNNLGNETASIHWHGMYMTNSPHMDGSPGVSQCAIPPGESFVYNFTAELGGNYWYHSHVGGQYADGLRGRLLVRDPSDPWKDSYASRSSIAISDWYHREVPSLLTELINANNTAFHFPLPDSALINEQTTDRITTLVPGKKNRIDLVNYSSVSNAIVYFQDHEMEIIAVDGIPVQSKTTNMIILGAGQRYDVLIDGNQDPNKNYPYLVMLDVNPDWRSPAVGFPTNISGALSYGNTNVTYPDPPTLYAPLEPFDDTLLSPYDNFPAVDPDVTVTRDFSFALDSEGIPRAWLNNELYAQQNVPSLYTAYTTGQDALDPDIYGDVNPVILEKNQVVQIVLNNLTPANHPFHLHGHHFQVIQRGAPGDGNFNGSLTIPESPLYRDTVMVEGSSYVVIRFLASRPGAWIFHCHMEWHVHMGATMTFITAPVDLQNSVQIPQAHFDVCPCGTAAGNAAGNTTDHFNMNGAVTKPMNPDTGALYEADTMAACAASGSHASGSAASGSAPASTAGVSSSSTPFFTNTTTIATATSSKSTILTTGAAGTVSPDDVKPTTLSTVATGSQGTISLTTGTGGAGGISTETTSGFYATASATSTSPCRVR